MEFKKIDSKPIAAIQERYGQLAESTCCLSCGGAVDHGKAQKGEYTLDLGSGRGNDVIRMADEVGSEGKAYGMDVSTEMLKKARRQAAKLAVENAEFIEGELESIPLEEDHIDLIISNCVINHAEDKDKVWAEVYRVLKPGGRFVVSDIYSTKEVPDEYRTDPEAIAECWAGSVERSVYMKQLEAAGFTDVQILEESEPYPKGKIEVVSWTVQGFKPGSGSCCK
jgi:arsenite methyltransferase